MDGILSKRTSSSAQNEKAAFSGYANAINAGIGACSAIGACNVLENVALDMPLTGHNKTLAMTLMKISQSRKREVTENLQTRYKQCIEERTKRVVHDDEGSMDTLYSTIEATKNRNKKCKTPVSERKVNKCLRRIRKEYKKERKAGNQLQRIESAKKHLYDTRATNNEIINNIWSSDDDTDNDPEDDEDRLIEEQLIQQKLDRV